VNRSFASTGLLGAFVLASAAFAGCRGEASEDPPFHLAPDMDWQSKRMAQQESPKNDDGKYLFADKRSSRPVVPGSVQYGKLKDDDAFYRGVDENGKHVRRMPVDSVLTATHSKSLADVAKRGEERFHIYCAPCHDNSGNGNGLVIQHAAGAFPPPTLFSSAAVKDMPDGQLFDTISHGIRNMPGYATQIAEADRWAIVLWVRILSKSQGATIEDVPSASRSTIAEPETAAAPAKEGGK
jgi:mono/diheme cytochrome c family protein